MRWIPRALWQVVLGAAGCALVVTLSTSPAVATTEGPDLVESLGWNPDTGVVFFRVFHVNESGYAPTILRLGLGRGANLFEPLSWSDRVHEDSTYRAKVDSLTRSLRPLQELLTTTIPEHHQVTALDTLRDDFGNSRPRFRVRVSWFNGACDGWVEAVTFDEPSLRMVRLHRVPGREELIGVFSFVGIPYETGYERQVPVLLPRDGNAVVRVGPE